MKYARNGAHNTKRKEAIRIWFEGILNLKNEVKHLKRVKQIEQIKINSQLAYFSSKSRLKKGKSTSTTSTTSGISPPSDHVVNTFISTCVIFSVPTMAFFHMMRNLKRKMLSGNGSTFSFFRNISYIMEKKNLCTGSNPDITGNIKRRDKLPTAHILLETEIYSEYKDACTQSKYTRTPHSCPPLVDIFYRGINLCDLCESCTFDEVVFLLLYKRLPSEREINEKRRHTEYAYAHFAEKKIEKIAKIIENYNLLDLVKTCLFYFSNQEKQKGDVLFRFYNVMAFILKLVRLFFVKRLTRPDMAMERHGSNEFTHPDISMENYDNVCQFVIKNCIDQNCGPYELSDEKKEREKQKIVNEKKKLLNVLFILMCENGINENNFLIRMLSCRSKNYFDVCLSAITLYIDTFKSINFISSLDILLNVNVCDMEKTKHTLNKIMETIDNEKLFFYKNNFFLKKNKILKRYLTNYCNITTENNVNAFKRFKQIENIFLKQKKYASCYYYTLLTFHVLGISPDFLPTLYFLARLPSFTAHINEQAENNKNVKYASVYIGNPPTVGRS
ncbi:citrate synthase-like protein, putative [Plasmodium ovale curtisi]|uniref:Citrate synthase-like protein, putative n=1 Tax=Plasmodium ovale curtisi TaxID=864141 RepID=A0A1A8WK03_PLAOA|nr:citrate synthase-like protein, putative [Plasmodium ovale curtisi]